MLDETPVNCVLKHKHWNYYKNEYGSVLHDRRECFPHQCHCGQLADYFKNNNWVCFIHNQE